MKFYSVPLFRKIERERYREFQVEKGCSCVKWTHVLLFNNRGSSMSWQQSV